MTDPKRPLPPRPDPRPRLNAGLEHGELRLHGKRLTAVEQRVDGHDEQLDELGDALLEQRETERSIPAAPPVVAEPNVARYRDAAAERAIDAQRRQSDADLEGAATFAAVIEHNARLEGQISTLGRAVVVVARELGVAGRLDPSLLASQPPPPPAAGLFGAREPSPQSRTTTRALLAALAAAVISTASLLERVVELLIKAHH